MSRTWWREHSLSVVLISIFSLMTIGTFVFGYQEFRAEQEDHAQPFQLVAFLRWWSFEYVMSLVADVFGAILLVILTKRLREAGSPESGDDDEGQRDNSK